MIEGAAADPGDFASISSGTGNSAHQLISYISLSEGLPGGEKSEPVFCFAVAADAHRLLGIELRNPLDAAL